MLVLPPISPNVNVFVLNPQEISLLRITSFKPPQRPNGVNPLSRLSMGIPFKKVLNKSFSYPLIRKRTALKLKEAALKKGSRPAVSKEDTFCPPPSPISLSSNVKVGILSRIASFTSSKMAVSFREVVSVWATTVKEILTSKSKIASRNMQVVLGSQRRYFFGQYYLLKVKHMFITISSIFSQSALGIPSFAPV